MMLAAGTVGLRKTLIREKVAHDSVLDMHGDNPDVVRVWMQDGPIVLTGGVPLSALQSRRYFIPAGTFLTVAAQNRGPIDAYISFTLTGA